MNSSLTAAIEGLHELVADVLVIGGGFAGLNAAIAARQGGASVILVDKAHVGRSGASAMTSGITTGPLRGQDFTTWIAEFLERGNYMADPAWTEFVLTEQIERLEYLDRLGPILIKEPDGSIGQYSSRGMVHVKCVQYRPKMAVDLLRAQATALGATILDRICITELLTSDGEYPTSGRVCGAVGFHTRSGQPFMFRAGAVVLASGPIAIKGFHVVDNDTGDGNALAARVGARHQDMEFATGGNFSVLARNFRMSVFNVGVAHGVRMVNARGERFIEQYDPIRLERTELSRITAAWIKELIEGRGPVYLDFTACDDEYWETLKDIRGRREVEALFESGLLPDARSTPIEIEPTRSYWSNGRGGVSIDLEARTGVPGLFCAGATAKNNVAGTHSSAGIPTAFSMTTGWVAGRHAAEEARGSWGSAPIDRAAELIGETRTLVTRPGRLVPDEAHAEIAKIIGNPIDTLLLTDAKLTTVLDRLAELRERCEADLWAPDLHELTKAHEAINTIDWCELVAASMRDRTESREGFFREDYPYTDDFEWRCMHFVRGCRGKLEFSREPIPYERYPFEPPAPRRELSVIGAILAGDVELVRSM